MSGFASLTVRAAGDRALRTIDVGSVLVALAVLFAVGAAQRSFARALVAVALVVASIGSAELLKHGLPHVPHGLPAGREASWPSGHTSVAVSLGLAVVLAVPAVARPLAALLGAAYAAGIGLSVVVLGWHAPSDVVGAFFLCGFWASVAAGLLSGPADRPSVSLRGSVAALVAVAGGLAVAALLAGAHPGAVAAARSSRSVVGVAALLGFLSLGLFGAYTPLVSERRR